MTGKRVHPETAPSAPPHRVRVPVAVHRWSRIAFLHWPCEPTTVARVLPPDLEVLVWEGAAWIGVTPFVIRVRPPGLPVPPGATFPETNVRTYVAGPDGRHGVWFLHMEAAAMWFVTALRLAGLPYHRRHMAVESRSDRLQYESRPATGAAEGGHRIVVRPGQPLDPPAGGPFERFLTAWWMAYHRRGVLLRTPVEHPPWQLHRAAVETCDVASLLRAAGLPGQMAAGQPLAHWSPGVRVRLGAPRPVG